MRKMQPKITRLIRSREITVGDLDKEQLQELPKEA